MPRQADSDHLERAYGDTTLFIVLSISRRHNNEQPPGKILSVSYFISFHVIYYVIKQSRQTRDYHISMILPSSYLFTCGGNNSSYTIFWQNIRQMLYICSTFVEDIMMKAHSFSLVDDA